MLQVQRGKSNEFFHDAPHLHRFPLEINALQWFIPDGGTRASPENHFPDTLPVTITMFFQKETK